MKISRVLFKIALAATLVGSPVAMAQVPNPAQGSRVISDTTAENLSPFAVPGRQIVDKASQQIGDEEVGTSVLTEPIASPISAPTVPQAALPTAPPMFLTGAVISDDDPPPPPAESAAGSAPAATAAPTHSHSHSSVSCDLPYDTSDFARCAPACDEYWVSAETLLWFGAERSAPPLITTAAVGTLPVAGAAGVTDAVGGSSPLTSGLLPGFRFTIGKWLDSAQTVGLAGRVYGIFAGDNTITTDGNQSIGRSFFNVNPLVGNEDAFLVNFNGGPNDIINGTATTTTNLNFVAADTYGQFLLTKSGTSRIDLLGGYTFNRFDDGISIRSSSVDNITGNFVPNGTLFDVRDSFSTANTFHGGLLGFQSQFQHGRVSLTTLSKISLGNFHQRVTIRGSNRQTLNGAQTFFGNAGVLAQASNSGTFTRDSFGFIPEVGAKLGYTIRPNLQFTVGYTVLYMSDVALAGSQIDRNVDVTQFVPAPAFRFQTDGYWLQGVDLGLTYSF